MEIQSQHNYDFSAMVNEIPAKFNRSNHRIKDGNGIPLEWLDKANASKNPQIPNNLLTTIKQAINSTEWSELSLFYTKRGKKAEFYDKFLDIISILSINLTPSITYHENDIDENSESINASSVTSICTIPPLLDSINTIGIPLESTPSITYHENDINIQYRPFSITATLKQDYKVVKKVYIVL